VGCADLAPLSASVAEVRSLVVDEQAQGAGLGRRLLRELAARAAATGFVQLCALTHAPAYFIKLGFSLVPHQWLPEKIDKDCRGCAQFRQCGQQAVVLPLVRPHA
jgi:amino-acid N-acetyltransferase